MGLKKFVVAFDRPSETYCVGENVTGRVVVTIDSPKKFRSLDLKIKGEAEVHWTQTRRRNRGHGRSSSETVHYRAHELYLEHTFPLLSEGEITLPAGEYTYPFNIHLPSDVPSSFEGTFGYIRYTAKAEIYRPWKFNHRTKTAFTVVSPLDLNTQESAKEPAKEESHKYFGCCCCKSGPLSMIVKVPVKGYVPGQEIPVTLEVDNASNTSVLLITCKLEKVVTFTAFSPRRKTRQMKYDIETIIFPEVPRGGSETSVRKLKVPALPPTGAGKCNIIDLAYKLKITAKVGGFHTNLGLSVPIIIGSIPLQSYQSSIQPFTEPPTAPTYGEIVPSAPPFEGYPDLPPPSYEECVFGLNDIKDPEDSEYTQGKLQFAPKYPMYNFLTH